MKRNHLSKRITFLVILLLIISSVIYFLVYSVYVKNDKIKSGDYHYLASLSPDLVIEWQKRCPNTWKDYIAAISSVTTNLDNTALTDTIKSDSIRAIIQQLDNGVDFDKIDWPDSMNECMKNAEYCRMLLEDYPFYTPGEYVFPIKVKSYYSDTYGAAREAGKRRHEGTDIFNEKGTPIISVCDGSVEKLGWNRLGGERVGVRGKDGNYYYYAHLDTINNGLDIGDPVDKGEQIGTMGNTGDALTTPDHLHFGIELPDGQWINPYAWLKVWEYNSDVRSVKELSVH